MSKIVAYVPTYSPFNEAEEGRRASRLTQDDIAERIKDKKNRSKPGLYFDAIDSILNVRPDIKLVVADGRSTDSIRDGLSRHHALDAHYELKLYPERMSQWKIFNDIYEKYKDYDYFIYSSSDVIWTMDWVAEAIKEFDKNPKLQILFPLVSEGDGNIPCQVAHEPRDQDPIKPPYDSYGKAPVLNAYAMIFRMDFLRVYGGYPDVFRNCFSESFLFYMCDAIGGEMRLLPRGWVWHWGLGDRWEENGSYYYFDEENGKFHTIMNNVQMAYGAGMLTKDYLKKVIYKHE